MILIPRKKYLRETGNNGVDKKEARYSDRIDGRYKKKKKNVGKTIIDKFFNE